MQQLEQTLPSDLFMDLDRSGPIPLYFQVSMRIESAILDGRLPLGSRLENEVALGERLGLTQECRLLKTQLTNYLVTKEGA